MKGPTQENASRQAVRKSAVRRSDHVSERDVVNLNEAAGYAQQIGLPLTSWKTISWATAGLTTDAEASTALRHYLKLSGAWLRRRGVDQAAVWVRETGPDVGQHVHMLMHVPPSLSADFKRAQHYWLKTIGAERRKGVVKSIPVAYRSGLAYGDSHSVELYRTNLAYVLFYALKGAEESTLVQYGKDHKSGGVVIGKRCGTTANLGRTARGGRGIPVLPMLNAPRPLP